MAIGTSHLEMNVDVYIKLVVQNRPLKEEETDQELLEKKERLEQERLGREKEAAARELEEKERLERKEEETAELEKTIVEEIKEAN